MKIDEYMSKYNEIARILMEDFAKAKKGENIVLSPMSVIMLLGIAADAVSGQTRDEIIKVIGDDISYDNLMTILKEIQEDSEKSRSLMSSNAVCVRDSISKTMTDGYEERLKKTFDGKLFSSADIVRDVNVWVKEKTKGMIEKVADDSMNQMMACLMNAIAFESEWMEEYEEDDIHEDDFNNADGTVTEVQMLESSEDTYIENEFFTGFVKPYKDEKYAFMALLPKKKESSTFLLRALKQIDYTKMFHKASYKTVYVTMPEFKYDFGEDLTGLCKELGINTLFTPAADFSPMSSEWLKVDAIIHKAHIEVDRHGTKAAAVTMAEFVCGCALDFDNIKTVRLDRPFVYAIMDTETGLPVFTGLYNQAQGRMKMSEKNLAVEAAVICTEHQYR